MARDLEANNNTAIERAGQATGNLNTATISFFFCTTRTTVILVIGLVVIVSIVVGVTVGTRPKP